MLGGPSKPPRADFEAALLREDFALRPSCCIALFSTLLVSGAPELHAQDARRAVEPHIPSACAVLGQRAPGMGNAPPGAFALRYSTICKLDRSRGAPAAYSVDETSQTGRAEDGWQRAFRALGSLP